MYTLSECFVYIYTNIHIYSLGIFGWFSIISVFVWFCLDRSASVLVLVLTLSAMRFHFLCKKLVWCVAAFWQRAEKLRSASRTVYLSKYVKPLNILYKPFSKSRQKVFEKLVGDMSRGDTAKCIRKWRVSLFIKKGKSELYKKCIGEKAYLIYSRIVLNFVLIIQRFLDWVRCCKRLWFLWRDGACVSNFYFF